MKAYLIREKHSPKQAYPIELQPSGNWIVHKYTTGETELFVEHRFGGRGSLEWLHEDQIHFIDLYENT